MLLAADISSHNTITDWGAFLASVDILTVKITEGTGYAWPGADAALAHGRAAGKGIGAYHFYGGGDPTAEADYFLAHYGWRPGEVPILDWEPTRPPADPDGVAAAFSQRVHDRLGVAPLAYMSSSTARSVTWSRTRSVGDGLWVAQYGANTGTPGSTPAVGGWGGYAEWQYTSAGARPGVAGPIDLSQFFGDAAAWRAYGTPQGAQTMTIEDDILANTLAIRQQDLVVLSERTLPAQFQAPFDRQGTDDAGNPQSGQVSLASFLQWSDSNFSGIRRQLTELAAQVTALQAAVAAAPGLACQGAPKAVLAAIGQAATAASGT